MTTSRDDSTTPALKRLLRDHKRIRKLLRRAGRAKGTSTDIAADVERACEAIAAHAELEDRWLYPALRRVSAAADATREAEVAHDLVRQLAAELVAMGPRDERYLATVRIMRVVVDHHIADEEDRLFDHARRKAIDLADLELAYAEREAEEATDGERLAEETVAHVVRAPDSPAEVRQRARGPGRRGAH